MTQRSVDSVLAFRARIIALVWIIRLQAPTVPNLITCLRMACAFRMFTNPEDPVHVFLLALLGALSDAIDGPLAKWLDQCTVLGKRLDQYADWAFGFALMYTIWFAEGLQWYNWPLIVIIGVYMIIRVKFLAANTTDAARKKTIMQFVGGVMILASPVSALFFIPQEATLLLLLGYGLLWGSLWHLIQSLREYIKNS